MSIRPVDMQVVVQKNQDIHQAKQTVVSKLDNELVHVQNENKNISLKKQQTVNQKERSELRKVKNDDENESERKNKKKKLFFKSKEDEVVESETDRSTNENNKPRTNAIGSRFDMKV